MTKGQEWLESLRKDDEVAVTRGRGEGYDIVKVARTTATMIILDRKHTNRFSRKDGREIGNKSAWSPSERITPVTDKIYNSVQRQLNLSLVEAHFRGHTCKLTDDQLARMAAIVQEKK